MNRKSMLNAALRCALVPLALAISPLAQAIDLGNASVLSLQGQRLKLAVPYGSKPGEKVPVSRFSIQTIEAPAGQNAPDAQDFVISQPEHRNIVYLQSREPVTAQNLKLVMNVVDGDTKTVAYDIAIPPMQYARTAVDETRAGAKTKRVAKRSKARTTSLAAAPFSKAPKAAGLIKAGAKNCGC